MCWIYFEFYNLGKGSLKAKIFYKMPIYFHNGQDYYKHSSFFLQVILITNHLQRNFQKEKRRLLELVCNINFKLK